MNNERRRWFFTAMVGFAVLPVVFLLPEVLPVFILELIPTELARAVNDISIWQRNVIAIGIAVAAALATALVYRGRTWWPIGLSMVSVIFVFFMQWLYANFDSGMQDTFEELISTIKWIGQLAFSWTTASLFISQIVVLAMVLTYFLAGRRLSLR